MAYNISRSDIMILGAILLIAAILRLVQLNSPLWYDEIYSVIHAFRIPTPEIIGAFEMNNHIFYSLQAKVLVGMFGEHNWSVRLPAFVFGLATIAVTWALGKILVGSLQAHVTALLMTVSYHHVWFSQNARGYTELSFWCALAALLMIIGLRKRAKEHTLNVWIGCGLTVFAALITHLTTAFFVASMGLVYCGMLVIRYTDKNNRIPENWKAPADLRGQLLPLAGFAFGGVLALIFYLPSFASLLTTVGAVSTEADATIIKEYENPLWSIMEVIRSFSLSGFIAFGFALTALSLIVVGGLDIARKFPTLPAIVFLHIPLSVLVLSLLSMRIWPRFFFIDLGYLLLFLTHAVFLACASISQLAEQWLSIRLSSKVLCFLATAAMLVVSVGLLMKNYLYPKQDLEGAVSFVEEQRQPGDKIIVYGWCAIPFLDYYQTDWIEVKTVDDLRNVEATSERVWSVVGFPHRLSRELPELDATVKAEFEHVQSLPGTLGDGHVDIYLSP